MSVVALLTVQNDFVGRLMADPEFSDVAIFAQRKALTESEIKQRLQTIAGRSGKIGVCVMVQMPVLDVVSPDLPGPSTAISQSLMVIEHPALNSGSQGTGKSAEQLAQSALRLFHHFVPFGVTQVFVGGRDAIVPETALDGLSAYIVTLTTLVRLSIPSKVVRPTIAPDGPSAPALVTLACATGGAAIWFTTDGSYPSSANPAALIYSTPFSQAVSATIRASAQLDGAQQSDIAQLILS